MRSSVAGSVFGQRHRVEARRAPSASRGTRRCRARPRSRGAGSASSCRDSRPSGPGSSGRSSRGTSSIPRPRGSARTAGRCRRGRAGRWDRRCGSRSNPGSRAASRRAPGRRGRARARPLPRFDFAQRYATIALTITSFSMRPSAFIRCCAGVGGVGPRDVDEVLEVEERRHLRVRAGTPRGSSPSASPSRASKPSTRPSRATARLSGVPACSRPSIRWQPQQPSALDRLHAGVEPRRVGEVRLLGVAAIAAGLRVLHREDRHLVEPVELPVEASSPSARPPSPSPASGRPTRTTRRGRGRRGRACSRTSRRDAATRCRPSGSSDGCVRKTAFFDVLEPVPVRRDVARGAAVHARDPHEVDVVEVLGQLDLLDAQRRVDHVEDRRVAQLEEGVLLQALELLPRELEVRRELLDRGARLVLLRRDPLDLLVDLRIPRACARPDAGSRRRDPRGSCRAPCGPPGAAFGLLASASSYL